MNYDFTTKVKIPLFAGLKTVCFILVLLCCRHEAVLATTYYNVAGSSTLQSTTQWGVNTDGSGTHPTNFTTSGDVFNLYNGSSGTIGAAWVITGVSLNVGNGSNAMNLTVPSGFSLTGTGVVNVSASGTLTLDNATNPTFGTLHVASTVIFEASAGQSIPSGNFGNVIIDNNNDLTCTGNPAINGTCTFTQGTIVIGSHTLSFNGAVAGMNIPRSIVGSSTSNLVIGATGNLGTIFFKKNGSASVLDSFTMNGGGSVTLGDNIICEEAVVLAPGKLSLNGKTLVIYGTFVGSAASGYLVGSSTSVLTTGTSGTYYFDQTTPGTSNNIATLTTVSGGITIGNNLNVSTALTLAGTVNDGGNTITCSGSITGTGTHTSTGSGKISITGANQSIPGATFGNLELNAASTSAFTLSGSPTINGALTFTGANNTLTIGTQTLTLNGTVSGMSATKFITGSTTSNLTISGSGALGTLFMNQTSAATATIQTLTRSGGGSATVGNPLTVSTTLALTSGSLADGGNIITVQGDITGTGTHTSTGSGKISMTGIAKGIGGATFGNLEFNSASASAFALTGSPAVSGALTFTGAANTLTIGSQTLTLNGTVSGMSATKFITGSTTSNLTIGASGSLGTLFLNPASAATRTIQTFSLTGGGSTTLGNPLVVASTLALTSGTLADGGNTITVQGNISGTGTHTSSGAGMIVMTTASSTISGATLGNLQLNNASGFSLSGSATIAGTLTLTSGRLTIGSNNLILGSAATVAGTLSSSNMIVANGSGQVRKQFGGAGSFLFPVGDNTPNYTPITLNFTAGSFGGGAYAGVKVINTKHAQNANTNNYLNRYWNVVNTIPSGAYTVSAARYVTGDVTGTEGNLVTGQYNAALPWIKVNGSSVNTGTHTLAATGSITNASADFTGLNTANPSLSVIPTTTTICSGSSFGMTATGSGDPSLSYTWAPATGLSATTGSAVTAAPTTTGSVVTVYVYTITATDGNGFKALATSTITVNPLSQTITGTNSVCMGTVTTMSNIIGGGTWSSSTTSVAIIGSASGVVNTVSTGTSIITYILSGGCTATTTVTVNSLPATISGPSSVCIGANITLSDAITGGSWASSNTAVVLVGSSGRATGVTPAVAVISYTLPTGCSISKNVTVNPLPSVSAITGASSLCAGNDITLSDATAGGVWGTSSFPMIIINPTTGVVTGFTACTGTISYAVTNSCGSTIATKTITVSQAADAGTITGSSSVLMGQTLTLNNLATGGAWSSSNANATVSNGEVTPVTPGDDTISYTVTTGCGTDIATKIITVVGQIVGPSMVCRGYTMTLSNATGGGTWSCADNHAVVDSLTGVVLGVSGRSTTIYYTVAGMSIPFYVAIGDLSPIAGPAVVCLGESITLTNATPGGTWGGTSVWYSIDSTGVLTGLYPGSGRLITYSLGPGCRAMYAVTVNPMPSVSNRVTSVCEGQSFTLTSTVSGGTWSSSNMNGLIGSSSGVVTGVSAGTSSISYIMPTGCNASRVVTVVPSPSQITGPVYVCSGQTITLSNGVSGGAWSGTCVWFSVDSTNGVVAGAYPGSGRLITYTLSSGCRTTYAVTVNPMAAITASATSICEGQTLTLSGTTTGGTWSSSTSNAPVGISSGIVTGGVAGTATISYIMPTGCNASRTVNINPSPSAITGPQYVCSGQTITLNNGVSGGTWSGTSVWFSVDSVTGQVAGSYPGSGRLITYTLGGGCRTTYGVTVNPTAVIAGSTAGICEGQTLTLSGSTSGGAWSSCHTNAAIGTSTGIVTGIAAGTATISYIMPTGCNASRVVTVNQAPSAITGPSNVCSGQTITLSNGVSGGTWIGSCLWYSVDSVNGRVTGGYPGAGRTITYTLGNGCKTTYGVTVNSLPTVSTISGGTGACVGSSVTLSNGTTGGAWSSSDASVAAIGSTGVVSGVSAGTAVIYYCVTNANSCTYAATATITISTPSHKGSNPTVTEPVEQAIFREDLAIVPNPNNGAFTVKGALNEPADQDVALEVTDMVGHVVYMSKFLAQNGNINEQVQLGNNLAKGIYLVNMRSGNESKVIRIAVQ